MEINGENESKKRKLNPFDNAVSAVANYAKDIRIDELMKQVTLLTEELAAEKRNREDKSYEEKIPQSITTPNYSMIIQEVKEAIGPLIEETLEKKLEEKLGMVRPDDEAVVQPTRRSYASTLQGSKTEQVNNFRDIVAAAKNEEKAEERERISRQNNIIIFGREETENDQDAPDKDKVFYNQLITDLTIGSANAKSIIRIGNKRDGGKRPIKVTLTSTNDKEKVMNNLRNL